MRIKNIVLFIWTGCIFLFHQTALADDQLADDQQCLDETQRFAYAVLPSKPVAIPPPKTKSSLGEPEISSSTLKDLNIGPLDKGAEDAISGLLAFLEKRTKAEMKNWLVNDMREKLCGSDNINNAFPNTCTLSATSGTSYGDISRNYDTLVNAIQSDYQALPACLIKQQTNNNLSYYFQSIYEQYKAGYKLEELLYSLSENREFMAACTDDKGQISDACGLVYPVALYASILDTIESLKEYPNEYKTAYATLFIDTLNSKLNRVSSAFSIDPTKLGELEYTIEKIVISRIMIEKRMADIARRADQIDQYEAGAKLYIEHSKELFKQLLTVTKLANIMVDNHKGKFIELTKAAIPRLHSIMKTQSLIAAKDYGQANLELNHLIRQMQSSTQCGENDKSTTCQIMKGAERFQKVSGALSMIASAKDRQDFENTLEALASPIGAWKARYEGDFTSLNAFVGLAYEYSRYSSAGFSGQKNDEAVIFAPLGFQYTTTSNGKSALGIFVSIIDLGNIAKSPDSQKINGGILKSEVPSDFDSVFSPGLYFTYSNKVAPITYGLGYSEGPNGYRTYVDSSGAEFEVDREFSLKFFIGIDLALSAF